jgi:hypothetical protein
MTEVTKWDRADMWHRKFCRDVMNAVNQDTTRRADFRLRFHKARNRIEMQVVDHAVPIREHGSSMIIGWHA